MWPGLKAFTLMELMTVIVIIGILASVSIPLVGKYLKKSKTSEASLNLRKIYDGELSYYQEETTLASGKLASKVFVVAPRTPSATPNENKHLGNWEVASWKTLKFAADGPTLYQYSTDAAGENVTASFTARAEGDIDGDGNTSLFERSGSVDPSTGEVAGSGAIFSLDDIE
jgi:type IV pilus assembly protein PilA